MNARVKPFRILRGIEVNIRADGSLDVDDEVLAQLDWVVASVHTAFDRSPTERILGAIDNPHVDCIGHLTGRRILTRPGADVDIERIVERAAETRTALEINSQPDRLDMRDTHARLAGEAGVLIPITTDAHSTSALGHAELGVGLARRAWLTKEQVLNTRIVGADREAPQVSDLRQDGAAALEWVSLPTSSVPTSFRFSRRSSRERSARRFPSSPPDEPEPFSAVLRDLDAVLHARAHALAEPPLLRVLRDHRIRARRSRRAPDRRAQPGRDPLAHVSRAPGARGGDARLARAAPRAARRSCTATSRTPRRRECCLRSRSRGPRVQADGSSSAPSTRTPSPTRPRSCSSSSCARSRSTTSSACARSSLDARGRVRRHRHDRDDGRRCHRPDPRDRRRMRSAQASGSTWTPHMQARRRCARSSAHSSPAGSEPTRSA